MQYKRADRVSELIKREVSVLLLQEVRDPRVQFVTVTAVETADDLRHANIYVSIMGDASSHKAAMEGLANAAKFIRGRLAGMMELRYAPDIHFKQDKTIDHALRIMTILKDLKAQPASESGDGSTQGDEKSES